MVTTGCGGATTTALPLRTTARAPEAEVTLVWVGVGETERLTDGRWTRAAAFDYEFTVVQRRYPDHWESVKSLHRRHPEYDGSAGARDQTMFFRVAYAPAAANGQVDSTVEATLGDGRGHADREFRTASLEMRARVS
jgi:hypothetical protein